MTEYKPIKCPFINNNESKNICGIVTCPIPYWNCVVFKKINKKIGSDYNGKTTNN